MRNLLTPFVLILSFFGFLSAQDLDTLVITVPESQDGQVFFDLKSPKATMTTHLYFLQEDSYDVGLAARTLFPGNLTQKEKEERATQLIQVYDGSGFYVDVDEIPDSPMYTDSTGKHRYRVSPQFPGLYLEKYEGVWLYSRRSVAEIPALHEKVYPFGADLLVNLLPAFGKTKFLGLHIWQYLGVLILMLLGILAYKVFNRILTWGMRRVVPRLFHRVSLEAKDALPVAKPLSMLLVTLLIIMFLPILQLPIGLSKYMSLVLKVTTSVFGILVAYQLVEMLAVVARKLVAMTHTKMDDHMLPLMIRIVKIIVVVFGIIFVLQNLDVNVTALLAGVSIGGLALALAAQDTVKNFLGSLSIFFDKPFEIGDYIATSSFEGSVIEVGVRSTRILDPGGAVLSIPNGTLANMTVTNHGARDYRRFVKTLNVTYDTPAPKIEAFVEAVREIVQNHPSAQTEGNMVQFHDMSDSSLDIYVSVFFDLVGYEDYLKARQLLLTQILNKATEMEIDFAFPSQTVYLEN